MYMIVPQDFNNPEVVKHFLDEVSVPSVVYFNDDPVQRQYFAKIFMNPKYSKVSRRGYEKVHTKILFHQCGGC